MGSTLTLQIGSLPMFLIFGVAWVITTAVLMALPTVKASQSRTCEEADVESAGKTDTDALQKPAQNPVGHEADVESAGKAAADAMQKPAQIAVEHGAGGEPCRQAEGVHNQQRAHPLKQQL